MCFRKSGGVDDSKEKGGAIQGAVGGAPEDSDEASE